MQNIALCLALIPGIPIVAVLGTAAGVTLVGSYSVYYTGKGVLSILGAIGTGAKHAISGTYFFLSAPFKKLLQKK